jgi:hypothetical protein
MEQNEEVVVDTTNNEAEGSIETDSVTLKKEEYEKLNQTIGSLKRELKDFKKPKEELKETAQQTKPDDNVLLQKLERMSLRQAGITEPDDIELAQKTAKKWGVDIDEVLADEDFKVKLERQQTARANIIATSNVRGSAGNSQAKNTPEYWQAKGVPPTPADVPDAKIRRAIVNKMMKAAEDESSGKFYNQ